MKNKMLTKEFVDLINDYKIDKITKLINGDPQSTKTDIKKGIKGFLEDLDVEDKKEFESTYLNALEPVLLENVVSLITDTYNFDFSQAVIEWEEEQQSEQYKAQSLRTKISNRVKKEITDQDTKNSVKRILNQYKLTYDLDLILEIIKKGLSEGLLEIIEDQQLIWKQLLEGITEKYNYANWLDWASSNAKNVSFATHIAKLTHSGISGASNIYFTGIDDTSYFSTSSLKNKVIEISQSNNSLAPIGKLLQLQCDNEGLSEQLKEGDLSVFEEFAETDEQLAKWRNGFLAVFKEKNLVTHYLAKQIYFPINKNDHCDNKNYHLINPMTSSSLDHSIFEKVNFTKYSSEMVEIRKNKREEKYHQDILVSYPNLAILKVTASNHGNASPLNGKRSGKRYLFPSMPPSWYKILTPPVKQDSLFKGEFDKRAWKSANKLQKYLIKLQKKEFGNKVSRDRVTQYIDDIINILFDYVLEIQAMPSGWSEQAKLKGAHALWLDINRDDQGFQAKRKSGQWQEQICQDFALWMNRKLNNKEMKLVKFEKDKWAKLLKNRLNLFDKGWGGIE